MACLFHFLKNAFLLLLNGSKGKQKGQPKPFMGPYKRMHPHTAFVIRGASKDGWDREIRMGTLPTCWSMYRGMSEFPPKNDPVCGFCSFLQTTPFSWFLYWLKTIPILGVPAKAHMKRERTHLLGKSRNTSAANRLLLAHEFAFHLSPASPNWRLASLPRATKRTPSS